MSFDPKRCIYLTKTGNDPYIAAMARGAGTDITLMQDFVYEESHKPLVFRGILKHKLMQRCRQDSRSFFYVDTGYFGNDCSNRNPLGQKIWHRVAHNCMQHPNIVSRQPDRFNRVGVDLPPQRRRGSFVMIVPPSHKSARYYGIDRETWIEQTKLLCQQHTDRLIEIREKDNNRLARRFPDSIKNCHVVVTFNSNAATESIMHGVPAIVLCEEHAAQAVSGHDVTDIENPFWPDSDLLYRWVYHLAYCQFTVAEMKRGEIWRILDVD